MERKETLNQASSKDIELRKEMHFFRRICYMTMIRSYRRVPA